MLLTEAVEVNAVAQGALWRFTQQPWIEHTISHNNNYGDS